MSSVYSDWLGRHVVLRVNVGEARLPLHGFMLSESGDSVRLRVDGGWEFEVYKEMIVQVDPARHENPFWPLMDPSGQT